MHRYTVRLLALPLAALLFSACSSDSNAATTTAAAAPAAPSTAAPAYGGSDTTAAPASGGLTVALVDSSLGKILADGDGRTLYLFTPDTPTSATCTGDCAANWPPLSSNAVPALGTGLAAEDFAVIAGVGGKQVTFYGHPLYYFAGDAKAGDVNGQGLGGKWYVIDPDGNPIKA